MRRVKNYEAEYSRFDSPIITYRDKTGNHTVEINAGGLWNVDVEVFREKEYTFVLSSNQRHPYVGIEKFLGHEPKGNFSVITLAAIEDVLGPKGLKLSPMTMAKRLSEYLLPLPEKHKENETPRETKNN